MTLEEIRCELHKIPELGRKEFKTQNFILDYVKNFRCDIYKPTETSVVLYFNANKINTICFRADMDGLPINEENDIPYKSQHENIMHACGHDGHMAMLLKFAEWANSNIDKLTNNIVCLFQPSEEDRAGALDIISSKILDKLKVDRIFGYHIWPKLEEGKLFTMKGGMLASSSEINIYIKGKSVHAANKKEGADALLAAVKFIDRYYSYENTITDRHLISFGVLNSGNVRNAISDYTKIEGTLRTYDEIIFSKMKDKMFELSKEIEQELNVKFEFQINSLYSAVINDASLVDEYSKLLNLNILDEPFVQAEDFGCYTKKYKSLFILIGAGINNTLLHTSNYNFNMNILKIGYENYIKIATK